MMKALKLTAIAGALTLSAGVAAACETDIPKSELTDAQVAELYDCIKDSMLSGYQKSGRPEAMEYRGWTMASTTPFISATHGNRFVNHYVNDIGREVYMRFAEEDTHMPVGSILAKESFTVNKKGKVRRGPLFLMEKMPAGTFPETADWKYAVILPNGKVMGETGTATGKKVKFCHACHENVLDGQDAMFYPNDDYRAGG